MARLVEAQVRRTPDATALVAGAEAVTYADLDGRAEALAGRLRLAGVGPETVVAVCLERTPELVVSLLAILKAGGAYLPLDPAYPDQRLDFMLRDSGAGLVLGRDRLPDGEPPAPGPGPAPDNLAYVIYTSGSTGRPKGVAITHRSACALLRWVRRCFAPEELAGVLASTSICFDLSVFEIFGPLSWGGTVILARDALELPRLAVAGRVTLVNTVPTAMAQLLRDGAIPPSVRTVNLAGEPLAADLARAVHAGTSVRRLLNLYGPTEDTTYSTWAAVDRDVGEAPPIGRPLGGTRCRLLDDRGRPVPRGAAGELYLGGAGLARGYLHRPDLTAERFVPDPFSRAGERLYRTGDLASVRPDGSLAYLGRADQQVKVRGFRVEPGEVEAALRELPDVREAVVVARPEGGNGGRLVAYLVPEGASCPPPERLRRHLGDRLPAFMVPSAFVALEALPLTPSGKVDRRALPAPPAARPELETEFEAPAGAAEERLAGTWRALLGVDRVGRHDDFFALGGSSLEATQVASRLRAELGVQVEVADLFASPTVAGLAAHLERAAACPPTSPPAGPGPEPRAGRLSAAQERMWFLAQLSPGSPAFNVPLLVRLRGQLRADLLEAGLIELRRRHETLRTRFVAGHGRPVAVVDSEAAMPLRRLEPGPEGAERRVAEEAARPFDLAAGPPIRAALLQLAEDDHLLLLVLHHAVTDGWSLGVLARELSVLYSAAVAGVPHALPPPTHRYADFTAWQDDWVRGAECRAALDYWGRQLADLAVAELPADGRRPAVRTYQGTRCGIRLPAALTRRVRELCRAEGVTLFAALLAVLDVLLARLTGQDDVVVGTPVAGRDRLEWEGLVGCLINNLVLRVDLSGDPTFREVLGCVRAVTVAAYRHQRIPFERLLEELQPRRDPGRTPLFQVLLNVHDYAGAELDLAGLRSETLPPPALGSLFDLTIYVRDRAEHVELEAAADRDLFSEPRLAELLRQLEHLLAQVTERPETRIGALSLVSPAARAALPDPRRPLRRRDHEGVEERFAAWARRTPAAVAVEEDGRRWTYADLARQSGDLAGRLAAIGVGRGDVVAIHGHRCGGLVVALLGVLQAGAAFLVLDPAQPPVRLAGHLGDCRPRAWIQLAGAGEPATPLAAALEAAAPACPVVPEESGETPEGAGRIPAADPDDLAYVVFTSGSTGRPKGVLGTRRPLGHFLDWYLGTFPLDAADRFAMLSGLGHDPLLRDVFAPLSLGATLCVPDPGVPGSPVHLVRWLASARVSVLHLTPVLARLLPGAASGPLTALRHVFFGGDRLTDADVTRFRRLAPGARLVSFYGATETPQGIAWFELGDPGPGRLTVPLGRGIPDVQLLVLTRAGDLAGVGERGEVHVRTPYLARGYLDDPGLTAARFAANPLTGDPDDRCYRTGDAGAFLPGGDVEFLGRVDDQVKIRGHRVEPGEVEAAIRRHPAVADAAVAVRADEDAGEPRLVAYVVPASGPAPGLGQLRRWLQERLPDPMLPRALVAVDTLPRTPNGKVDRRSLPPPDREGGRDGPGQVAPRGWLERTLADIWREVLRLPAVGVQDNFFDLGGTSLAMAEVQGRIREVLGRELRIVDLFTHPNVAALAEHLSGAGEHLALVRAAHRTLARAAARSRRARPGPQVSTE